jgi:hypothetical protein
MKRIESLFTSPKRFFKRLRSSASFTAYLCLSLTILSACNNISSNLRAPSSLVALSDPSNGSGSGNFTIQTLAADAVSPATVIDLIGVGSGSQFDQYCALGTCLCEYSYSQNGVGSQTASTPVTYQESNMLRCANIVPSGITQFQVRIIVVPSGGAGSGTPAAINPDGILYTSNTLDGNFTSGALAGSTSYLDLTNAATYVPVQRFQCRKRDFIENPMNAGMIDTFQSQNPAIIYPFNYYTTNVAQSLLTQQQSTDASWECSLNATSDHSLQWWANPNVFSLSTCTSSFCSGDGALMYPQNALTSGKVPVANPAANGKRRSSFYLASSAYSVFSIPVKAAISPVNYVASNYAVIGYAAKPIANTSGTSSCPNIALPPKSTWVKLWNFRATDITASKKVTGSQSITNTAIVCDSTHPSGAGNDYTKMIFPSCEMPDPNNKIFGTPLDAVDVASGVALASRVAALTSSGGAANPSACYNFGQGNHVYGTEGNQTGFIPWASNYTGAPAPNLFAGLDLWLPSPYKLDDTITLDMLTGYAWNVYANASTNVTNGTWKLQTRPDVISGPATVQDQFLTTDATFAQFVLPAATPTDYSSQLTTVALSTDNYTDQIFVVTEPTVSDTDMRNNASSIQQYVPRTFRSQADCPGPAACDPNATGKTPITWGINTLEIGASSGSDMYPLCVLQFYD